eukprot:gb/GFBE01049770.1/.p1 GENE.gb/GFBE01049770.1/~~gb/GFBE01049770.1/.p1  ORF type:complete len:818 (+),score=165.21 gb/GFBE01049770.1/:1-2454(+)
MQMKAQSAFPGATPSPARGRSSLGAASLRSSLGSNEGSAGASKNLVPMTREQQRSDPFMGATIGKFFGSQFFHGQVIAIDVDVISGERAYHIAYEDGDEEHLSVAEVRQCFVRHGGRSAPASEAGGVLSAAGSRRPSTTLAYSSAPTPRPSTSGATGSRHPAAGASWHGSVASAREVAFDWSHLALAAVAVVVAAVVLPACWSCVMGSAGTEGDHLLMGGSRSVVGGLAPPLPPWAQEASLAAAGAVPAQPGLPSWAQPQAGAALAQEAEEKLEDDRLQVPREEPQQQEIEDLPAASPAVPSWAAEMPQNDAFAQLPPEKEEEPSTPAPPVAEFAAGQAPATAESLAEEEMAAAAAALAEASGLVLRVAAKSFFKELEEAWQGTLSGFSSATSAFGAGPSDLPPVVEVINDEDEVGIFTGLHDLITFLLASIGVLTILFSIFPCQAWPVSAIFSSGQPRALGFGIPAQHAMVAGAAMPGQRVPASPQRLAAAPSPPPLQHSPAAHAAPSPKVAPRRVSSVPAPITPSASLAATQCEGTGARTLMGLMGRTPGPATTAPAATNTAGAQARPPLAPVRRPPPPPASLMQAAPQPQMQTPQPQMQTPQIQVNAWYVEAAAQCQERVVKVVALRQDSAFVQPYALNRLRSGKLTFSRDKRFAGEVLVKVADLKDGPFHIAAGGRAPAYINARFGGPEESEQQLPPVPPFHAQAKSCAGCGHAFAQEAMFCRICGQPRGVEGPTTPMPLATPGTAMSTGGRLKSKLVIDESRFRYTAAMAKMKEMGFEDCPALRDVLTKWGGDVTYALREINGSPSRGGGRA